MFVVFGKQAESNHEVVDIIEHEGVLRGISGFLRKEGDRVITPVAHGVQVVRGVVAIVEAVAVALGRISM